MTVQSAIFYITKIVDSATFVYKVYHDLVSTNQILRYDFKINNNIYMHIIWSGCG